MDFEKMAREFLNDEWNGEPIGSGPIDVHATLVELLRRAYLEGTRAVGGAGEISILNPIPPGEFTGVGAC